MKTKIIYEDEVLIVCYKPAGIAVQTSGSWQQDVESELKNYIADRQKGSKAPYLAVIHRLDQPVSGLLVFAKTKEAAASLSAQIQDGRAGKIYRAVVHGTFEEEKRAGVLEHFLLKDAKTNTSKVVQRTSSEFAKAKKAKLAYKVLGEEEIDGEMCSEVEIELFTGRHHQIRVQLSEVGHPIVGDCKYGDESEEQRSRGGLKLCACRLSFYHPKTGKRVEYSVSELCL